MDNAELLEAEGKARMTLLMFAHAVDPLFQHETAAVVTPFAGKTKHATVKSRNRCWLKATTDYKDDREPTDARNADVVYVYVCDPYTFLYFIACLYCLMVQWS